MNILIIEDEYKLADAISTSLKNENYETKIVTNGVDGEDEALTNNYDLIILDVMLPGKDGFSILKEIKKNMIDSKIIMVTAKNQINDKLQGFNEGCDDYITKPFHMDELIARCNNQLRKDKNGINNKISFGNITLDLSKKILLNNETEDYIDILGKEFNLLELFLTNPEQVLEKEQIFLKVWGYDSDSEINSLEAYISFVRKKLVLIKANVKIRTLRNTGYKMEVI